MATIEPYTGKDSQNNSMGDFESLVGKSQSPISLSGESVSIAVSNDGFAMQTAKGDVVAVPQMLFDRLSFTHIVQLIHLGDPLKRAFYAIEAMRGPWNPNLFVAQYELQLPSKEKIREFLMRVNKG